MSPNSTGWQTLKIEDVVGSINGGLSLTAGERPAVGDEHGILTLSAVSSGHFDPSANKAILNGDWSRLGPAVRAKTVLITRSNTFDLVGACVFVDEHFPKLHLPDLIWELSVDESRFDPHWLSYALASPPSRSQIKSRATGTSASMKKLSMASLLGMKIVVPPFPEQKAIAAFLSTWDRGIREFTYLIAAKIRFKQGLTQQLLTRKLRFKGYRDEWHSIQLRELTTECAERNRGQLGVESVMAVTKAAGIIPMRERTIGVDIGRYQIVRRNWFAYNPMRLNIGSIARWSGDGDILVSPDYVVFRCKDSNGDGLGIDPDYLDHLRCSGVWQRFVTAAGNGSVRVRIYFSDLGHLKFALPNAAEQRTIATTLNSTDKEIDLLRNQLEALKQQKKGLMQKLLTGEVRVKLPKGVG